ncbi:MAG: protein-methionine-sulfoxide reductase heme-binding subunit MsrQ [Gammaproteobacteria bacterium]|nr:MAG: protein-methionine-sulfoxide reductase heme-binding subunit MsrQ [Gammaproteobacteria bacterium]
MSKRSLIDRILGGRWLKPAVFVAALLPLGWLIFDALRGELGANPIEEVIHRTGLWALRLLLLTLAMSPLRRLTGRGEWLRLRRMLGLFAFFYATLHLLSWVVLDQFFDWPMMLEEILRHPYITVGMAAWLLLVPLAVTSTQGMMRRLGRRWKALHSLVYVIAVLGVLHFVWLVKADVREPLIYLAILAVLLVLRLDQRFGARLISSRSRYSTQR